MPILGIEILLLATLSGAVVILWWRAERLQRQITHLQQQLAHRPNQPPHARIETAESRPTQASLPSRPPGRPTLRVVRN